MKLLVLANTPPPFHGQSYMIQLMLDRLAEDTKSNAQSIPLFHVNCQLSRTLRDAGSFRLQKLIRCIGYSLQTIWLRFRYGIDTLYYVPAPPEKKALYRDILVMLLCRPFFKRVVFHWHAAGLGQYVSSCCGPLLTYLAQKALGHGDLSLILANSNRADPEIFAAKQAILVPNGIPDPCPNFEKEILPLRKNRLSERLQLLSKGIPPESQPKLFRILFLSICTKEKGLFLTLDSYLQLAQDFLDGKIPFAPQLHIAGEFICDSEEIQFKEIQQDPRISQIRHKIGAEPIVYHGVVRGETKKQLFTESDCLCFPTYLPKESFGLVVIEAMAHGLPIVASTWRAIPELLPPNYPFLSSPQDASLLTKHLLQSATSEAHCELRSRYEERFTLNLWIQNVRNALLQLEK